MIKKRYLITKTIFQIFLYLVEVIGISFFITMFTNRFSKIVNFIDFLERMTIFYTFYQILIYGILQQLNDIKKDQYLAILSMYKYVEIYNQNKRKVIASDILRIVEKQLDSSMFNDNAIRNEYLKIKELITNNKKLDDEFIKTMIIKYEHCCEAATLNWKYSILTRLIK